MASVGGGNDVVSINKAGFEQMTRAINKTTTAVENQ